MDKKGKSGGFGMILIVLVVIAAGYYFFIMDNGIHNPLPNPDNPNPDNPNPVGGLTFNNFGMYSFCDSRGESVTYQNTIYYCDHQSTSGSQTCTQLAGGTSLGTTAQGYPIRINGNKIVVCNIEGPGIIAKTFTSN